jgi:hypothetical protein
MLDKCLQLQSRLLEEKVFHLSVWVRVLQTIAYG